jgi:hypothetical protein
VGGNERGGKEIERVRKDMKGRREGGGKEGERAREAHRKIEARTCPISSRDRRPLAGGGASALPERGRTRCRRRSGRIVKPNCRWFRGQDGMDNVEIYMYIDTYRSFY